MPEKGPIQVLKTRSVKEPLFSGEQTGWTPSLHFQEDIIPCSLPGLC